MSRKGRHPEGGVIKDYGKRIPVTERKLDTVETIAVRLGEIREEKETRLKRQEMEVKRDWEAQIARPVSREVKQVVSTMGRLAGNQAIIGNLYVRMVLEEKRNGMKRSKLERFSRIKAAQEAIGIFLKERWLLKTFLNSFSSPCPSSLTVLLYLRELRN